MSDHYHYEYASDRHEHRGQYAEDRHDHDLDYAEKHHRHYDLETDDKTAQQAITCLRVELDELRREFAGMLAQLRVLGRLRPTCAICRDAAADRQTVRGPACTDCVGDPPEPEAAPAPYSPFGLADQAIGLFLEYRDRHGYAEDDARRAATLEVAEGMAALDEPEPEAADFDPGPEVDDEGGMSEHRYYVMPEDYERGQS